MTILSIKAQAAKAAKPLADKHIKVQGYEYCDPFLNGVCEYVPEDLTRRDPGNTWSGWHSRDEEGRDTYHSPDRNDLDIYDMDIYSGPPTCIEEGRCR